MRRSLPPKASVLEKGIHYFALRARAALREKECGRGAPLGLGMTVGTTADGYFVAALLVPPFVNKNAGGALPTAPSE